MTEIQGSEHIMATYGRLPVAFVRGEGAYLYDRQGKRYLDFTSGIGVTILGHAHPAITAAIQEQAGRMLHCSNLYHIPQQAELAEKLCRLSQMDHVFFANSGAEANEAAIKLARRYGQSCQPARYEILTLVDSFHGRTIGALSATGQTKYQSGFGPLVPGFRHLPADLEAFRQAMGPQTAAVLLEPVQGEGGVFPLPVEFLRGLRRLCDEHGVLLIFDEVQSGMGRTGKLFAFEHAAVVPDVLTLAKGLANGVPIGAMLARRPFSEYLTPGTHASTFGGNPLACSAALATIEVLETTNLSQAAAELGNYLNQRLQELVGRYPAATAARGLGLMQGLVLDRPAGPLVQLCLEKGLLVTAAGGNVLRFLPPLIIGRQEIEEAIALLTQALGEL